MYQSLYISKILCFTHCIYYLLLCYSRHLVSSIVLSSQHLLLCYSLYDQYFVSCIVLLTVWSVFSILYCVTHCIVHVGPHGFSRGKLDNSTQRWARRAFLLSTTSQGWRALEAGTLATQHILWSLGVWDRNTKVQYIVILFYSRLRSYEYIHCHSVENYDFETIIIVFIILVHMNAVRFFNLFIFLLQ